MGASSRSAIGNVSGHTESAIRRIAMDYSGLRNIAGYANNKALTGHDCLPGRLDRILRRSGIDRQRCGSQCITSRGYSRTRMNAMRPFALPVTKPSGIDIFSPLPSSLSRPSSVTRACRPNKVPLDRETIARKMVQRTHRAFRELERS